MATKTRKKKIEPILPRDTNEANEWIREIVEADRVITEVEAELNRRVCELQAEAEERAKPLAETLAARCAGLRRWADANWTVLADSTAPKTITLTAGELCKRTSPPAIRLTDVKAILEICKHRKLTHFIRVKEEFDKQAALKDLETAKTIPGVSVGQEENFFIRPNELSAVAEYSDRGKRLQVSA